MQLAQSRSSGLEEGHDAAAEVAIEERMRRARLETRDSTLRPPAPEEPGRRGPKKYTSAELFLIAGGA